MSERFVGGRIVFGAFMPSSPVILPEVAKERHELVQRTYQAMLSVAERIASTKPEAIILISPHANLNTQSLGIYASPLLGGDFSQFRTPELKISAKGDLGLRQIIVNMCRMNGLPLLISDRYQSAPLDYGLTVPLYFLQKAGLDIPIVPILTGQNLPPQLYVQVGQMLREAVRRSGMNVAIVASGTLSSRLDPEDDDHSEAAVTFDKAVANWIAFAEWENLLNIDPNWASQADESCMNTLSILLGSVASAPCRPEVVSYESPYGIGYFNAAFEAGLTPDEERLGTGIKWLDVETSDLPSLAYEAAKAHLTDQSYAYPIGPLAEQFGRRTGAFLSLYREGRLLRTLGTVTGNRPTAALEVVANAIAVAVMSDPNYPALTLENLSEFSFGVQLVKDLEPIVDIEALDPTLYGLIASSGYDQSVILPNTNGITNPQEQLMAALRQANIMSGEPLWLYRFSLDGYGIPEKPVAPPEEETASDPEEASPQTHAAQEESDWMGMSQVAQTAAVLTETLEQSHPPEEAVPLSSGSEI